MSPMHQLELNIETEGRGTYDLTRRVADAVKQSGIATGLCHIFLRHTSASLMLCENADPAVMHDLESFMSRLAPDGDPMFTHTAEGPDDMPAHVRSVLTHNDLQVPVRDSECDLGTWQGIYLWEHRHAPHRRSITLTISGV
ncbi:MAG: secondary thiamine-phosphate synthase enzyme YjbQ [Woeseiaceae bacterium]